MKIHNPIERFSYADKKIVRFSLAQGEVRDILHQGFIE